MKKDFIENKIQQLEESMEICRFNYSNQKKKFDILNSKITATKILIESLGNTPSSQLKKLENLESHLNILAQWQKNLLLELQKEFKKAIKSLNELKELSEISTNKIL